MFRVCLDNIWQDSLRKELDVYNAHRGARPEISWKEAPIQIHVISCDGDLELLYSTRFLAA